MTKISLHAPDHILQVKKFAGGENHINLNPPYIHSDIRIDARLNSADDIMNLCLTVDAARRCGAKRIEVFIPYIPYARQDRVMVKGEPLSIKVFANIINSLELDKIIVMDAHSDVSVALLNNCSNISNIYFATEMIQEHLQLKDFVLVSPDLGAYKKTEKLARELQCDTEPIIGIKIRNLATGEIIKTSVNCTEDLRGRTCVVVDDICDGGRTFTELAIALKEKGAGDLYLIVTHGIFSYGALPKLKEAGYKTVCSTNSIADREESEFYKQSNIL